MSSSSSSTSWNLSLLSPYLSEHESAHLAQLMEFLRIPSISTLPEHQPHIQEAAEWLAQAFRDAGLEHVEIIPTAGHPVVYGDWLHAPGKPTLLIYGHYDVQPADPLELWTSPPFEPQIRDHKIYARGATDDKGQLFLYVKAVESFLRTYGRLPLNLKFCIEGEEEIGSPHLPPFIEQHQEKLRADFIALSDTSLLSENQPALMYSLRGLACLEIQAIGANTDLHSGLYGGGVPNPIHALTQLLSTFHDPDGRVAVEGFYADVLPLTEKERSDAQSASGDEDVIRQQLGLNQLFGEPDYSYYERTTARPTFEITSISGGFTGEGIKGIVPARATAKIACRLVANQNPEHILELIEKHIALHQPPEINIHIARHPGALPFFTPTDHPAMHAAAQAYADVYGDWPIFTRGGGSIPILAVMQSTWDVPVIMLGFGLPDENLHAPNEHFHLVNWQKGITTISHFWANVSKI